MALGQLTHRSIKAGLRGSRVLGLRVVASRR
jgi:hypothetical protein